MSLTIISGNFSIFGAEIVQTGRFQHVIYKTSVHTDDGRESFPAYIRAFLPHGSTTFEDNTTIFLYGKLSASCRSPFLIEVINMFRYPGDPADPLHGAGPSFAPRRCILGHVQNTTDVPSYEGHRTFSVLASAYVRDQIQTSSFTAFFDGSPRWKNTAIPIKNSSVFIFGALTSRSEETQTVRIRVEDLAFNLGPRSDMSFTEGSGAKDHKRNTPSRPSARSAWANGPSYAVNGLNNPSPNGSKSDLHAENSGNKEAETRTAATTQVSQTTSILSKELNGLAEAQMPVQHHQGNKLTCSTMGSNNNFNIEMDQRPINKALLSTLPLGRLNSTENGDIQARIELVNINGKPSTPHPWNPEPPAATAILSPQPVSASTIPLFSSSLPSSDPESLTAPPPVSKKALGRPKRKAQTQPTRPRGGKRARTKRITSPIDDSSDVVMTDGIGYE
ncbi:hypothetical protein M422DRAFT_252070 [Sphaerobolus stellatus SS14]|uniref:Uncharacterized protein n=1 Tax=Sphaerobolus stellatus (strain SS14) TaxID=990650 RepID=A0A0C9VZF2_SPHS4|nr:hypothetical protein M422DRAFT_252070 [Sphaerobolus stellatus SS14]